MKFPTPFLATMLFCLTPAGSSADEVQKLRSRGAELYYLDADLRAALAKENPKALPEAKHKLPAATAAAFDWTAEVKRPFTYSQRKSPFCWAFAAVTAFEYNWAIRNGSAAPALAI